MAATTSREGSNPGRTTNKVRSHLRAALSWAWEHDLLEALPRFPRLKPQRDIAGKHYLTKAEINALYFATHQGPLAALACIYVLGSLVTELITNNAAAVLMFPFCLETAKLYDASPLPFVIALMLAASASFMTPVGYQTNMMVYGPGGYQFSDFFKIGAPLNAILAVVAVVLIPYFWPFY